MTDATFKENLRQEITVNNTTYGIFNIMALERQGMVNIGTLPFSIRVLLENVCRHIFPWRGQ